MVHRWRVRHPSDARGALSLPLVIAACAAYSLVLTIGVVLFGLAPRPEAPGVPPHDLHRHQVTFRLEPTPKGHVHTGHDHLRGHTVHKRLSPKELSLAKW